MSIKFLKNEKRFSISIYITLNISKTNTTYFSNYCVYVDFKAQILNLYYPNIISKNLRSYYEKFQFDKVIKQLCTLYNNIFRFFFFLIVIIFINRQRKTIENI